MRKWLLQVLFNKKSAYEHAMISLTDAELALLEAEHFAEYYQSQCAMLRTRINRLHSFVTNVEAVAAEQKQVVQLRHGSRA